MRRLAPALAIAPALTCTLALALSLGAAPATAPAAAPAATPAATPAAALGPAPAAAPAPAAIADSAAALSTSAGSPDFDAVSADSVADEAARQARAQAGIDSLNAYWRRLDSGWYEPLTPDLLRPALNDAALDSLTDVGDRELTALLAGRRWRTSVLPLLGSSFNRCEGWRPASGILLRRLARQDASLTVDAGYGFARERIVWNAALSWPLRESAPLARDDRPALRPWTSLALVLSGGDGVVPFAGDALPYHTLEAIVTGDDPNMYHARRWGQAELVWRPRPRLETRAGFLLDRHRAVPVATTWNLSGTPDQVDVNWAIPPLASRALTADVGWHGERFVARAQAQWHHVIDAPDLPTTFADPAPTIAGLGHADFLRLRAEARHRWLDRRGNEFVARAIWQSVDRAAPIQWRTYLGGENSLRGYPARELSGERGAIASLDVRGGFDPLRALRVPLLGRLRLQPLVFADLGWTAGAAGTTPLPTGAARPPAGATGWRSDAGLGFGRLLGVGSRGHLRFYFAKPLFNGQSSRPWRLQVEFGM